MCSNDITQRASILRKEGVILTSVLDYIITTGVIGAKQKIDLMMLNIPNVIAEIEITLYGDHIIMKIRGQFVYILFGIYLGVLDQYFQYREKQRIMYVRMLKVLYGMLAISIFYQKIFRKEIEGIGFEFNPYNICVANRMKSGKQQTVTWHVDYFKSRHVDHRVNDEFTEWCE